MNSWTLYANLITILYFYVFLTLTFINNGLYIVQNVLYIRRQNGQIVLAGKGGNGFNWNPAFNVEVDSPFDYAARTAHYFFPLFPKLPFIYHFLILFFLFVIYITFSYISFILLIWSPIKKQVDLQLNIKIDNCPIWYSLFISILTVKLINCTYWFNHKYSLFVWTLTNNFAKLFKTIFKNIQVTLTYQLIVLVIYVKLNFFNKHTVF